MKHAKQILELQVKPNNKWLCDLGNSTDGVFIANAAQRIIFWSKGAERILGHSQAEVSDRHCYEVLAGRCCDKLWCHANCNVRKSARRGILPDGFDILTHTREGRNIWVAVSTIVLPGRKNLLVHLFRDVTRQKRDEEVLQNILSFLGMRGFPNGNPEGEQSAVRSLICRDDKLLALSRREVEVMHLLAEGLSTLAMAQRIGVSPFTIRNHIRNVLKKLGLHSRAQAVSFVLTESHR